MNQLWKKQASVAYGYSLTRLALNEYMYLDAAGEREVPDKLKQYEQQFHHALIAYQQKQECLLDIQNLRRQLQQEMEVIVAFTDCFRIYEYALNRVERKFDPDLPAAAEDDETFTQQLLAFVSGAGEAAVLNQRVQLVIGQLPVRFTRQKFYSMVREALSIYVGSDRSGLENIMYLLKTSAMVALSEAQTLAYPQLQEWLKSLEQLDFKTLTGEQYHAAMQLIALAEEQLYQYSECYQMLQDMVNDLYVLALTADDAIRDTGEEKAALILLDLLSGWYQSGTPEADEDEVIYCLEQLEGVQEHYYEKFGRLAGAPELSEDEDAWAAKSRLVERLLSTSSFAELEDSQGEETADRQMVDQTAEAFFQQLDTLFSACQKPVMRAVMAAVLSSLPVCFNSLDELGSYIRGSLASCLDTAEKATCLELLEQIMESENDALL